MLRGAFGHALRRLVCVMGPGQDCRTCRLRRECVYTRLFETFVDSGSPPFLRGLPTSPRPYIVEPGRERQKVTAGEPLDFDLVLVGQAAGLQAFAVLAVERMAAAGLGQRRHRFTVERVACREPDGRLRELLLPGQGAPGAQPPGAPSVPDRALADPSRVVLRFATPTRLKIRDHPSGPPGSSSPSPP